LITRIQQGYKQIKALVANALKERLA